jgi:alpha,alpha-trehalase
VVKDKEWAVSPSPIQRFDGYLPIEDHGLIGDGSTAALVGRDGIISWLCVPRFDSPALFCSILDRQRGGGFQIAPEDLLESRQRYLPNSGVLVTELIGKSGRVEVIDALTLRAGAVLTEDVPAARGELLRVVKVLQGRMRLKVAIEPRGGASAERRVRGWRICSKQQPELDLQLYTDRPLDGLHTILEVKEGERFHVSLRWGHSGSRRHHPPDPDDILEETRNAWERWLECFSYQGPQVDLVRRSAITLKLLDHFENGAIVAAPTSSLPEELGGIRNWDYRYTWIRDAAFSVYALRRIGLAKEAWGFLAWVLDVIDSDDERRPRILYTLNGEQPPPEQEDPMLEGYRQSPPVRWGNAAADQRQHDVFGEILDCAYQWAARGGEIDPHIWKRLSRLVEAARKEWNDPDHGIWEIRSSGRPFTYSAALCQVALDRGVRLAKKLNLSCDMAAWQADADHIRQAIIEEAWSEQLQSFTGHLGAGGQGLDASLLTLPLRRVIPADHPRMVATTERVIERIGAGDGLLYRYLPEESPDGLPGHEGAFVLCSFWLVDNLALQGRLDEALELYDSLCKRANPLGLLAEEIDPSSGAFLGNFPQAFSHVGLISSGVTLARLLKQREER